MRSTASTVLALVASLPLCLTIAVPEPSDASITGPETEASAPSDTDVVVIFAPPSSTDPSTTEPSATILVSSTPPPPGSPDAGRPTLVGCISSPQGYPSFSILATSALMEPAVCIDLARKAGQKYAGVFDDSCYGASSLEATSLVDRDDCDLACPGDPALTCGGFLLSTRSTELNSRAAPANILMSLYELADDDQSSTSTPEPVTSTTPPQNGTGTAGPGPIITTVTYTIVDPNNPGHLIPTEYCATLQPACERCAKPTVSWTTTEVSCHRCGDGGKDRVTLTVPCTTGYHAKPTGPVASNPHGGDYTKVWSPTATVVKPTEPMVVVAGSVKQSISLVFIAGVALGAAVLVGF